MKIDTYSPPLVSGYTIVDQLSQGSRTRVYRALKNESQQPVVIKVLRHRHPNFEEQAQFRCQYTIAHQLNHPAIVSPLALENCSNGYALVMPDDGFVALPKYWQRGKHPITAVLKLAMQLADALDYLITQRVIHKDIKPDNLLIHPETRQVQLIDFSIASLLPKEHQQLANPNVLEGTLAYLSPEQTGRMNRGIDYRTDFYSLGVTLFELLVGHRPFVTHDAMELVHAHMTQPVTFPAVGEQRVPAMVQAVVLKLMAKNPEDRYQSALGLKHDLERCLKQIETHGALAQFELGERDGCDRFLIPERLYGRDTEVQTLLAEFDRVVQGQAELMLVAGFSGVGKTAVINEIHRPVTRQKGYFIQGKFDQFNRNVPFSAFVQAFRSLMRQLLGQSDAVLATWTSKILAALGQNGQVLIDVIPELERIIGQQPEVPVLSGNAAQNRFNLLLGKFVRVFAAQEHPLVIFLDDLQWADSASLQLLQCLMDESELGYLLVLGAYRDNEVFPAHPLMLTLAAIQKQGTQIKRLSLMPLGQAAINQLVADTLLCSIDSAGPLSQLVYQKTQGNPFFTTQFLQGLYDEGCLSFDPQRGYWQCDLTQVQQLILTDDVVEFMVGRLQKLPDATQDALKLAACIGNHFDLETLALAGDTRKEQAARDLWRGLQEGFILPEGETYKFFQDGADLQSTGDASVTAQYRFLHDRVQQAAEALIAPDQKCATRLNIGRQLLRNLSVQEQNDALFTIVNHLNVGAALVCDPGERQHIAQLNWQASQKAKATVAYEVSRNYAYAGQKLLESEGWSQHYEMQHRLAIATIEAEYFCHHLQTAQELAQVVLAQSRTLLDRVKVYELQILFEISQNRMNEAIAIALDVLALLDIKISTEPQQLATHLQSLRQAITLPATEIANLATLPTAQDATKLAAVRILTNATSAAYIANPQLFPAIVMQTVQQCMTFGHSALAASAYSWYGALLCGVYSEIDAGYEFGKLSLQLLEQFDARDLVAKVRNMFDVFIRPWKEPIKQATLDLPKAIHAGFENGDTEYAFYAAVHYCNYLFYQGILLETIQQEQARYLASINRAKYDFHAGFLRINQQAVANLCEPTDTPAVLNGSILDGPTQLSFWQSHNIVFLVLCFYEAQTRLAYLFEDYNLALEAGAKGYQYRQAALGTLYVVEHNFYYSLALLSGEQLDDQGRDRVFVNQAELKQWAESSPANFQHKYDLVAAEWERHAGHAYQAMEQYDLAIAGAKAQSHRHEEALGNELAAKFYLNWGKPKIAAGYLQDAYCGYAAWGAKTKLQQLEAKYPQLLQPILQRGVDPLQPLNSMAVPQATVAVSHKSESTVNQSLDLATILKASQVISSTLQLEELLAQLTQIILQNSGSDRCAILLCEPDHQIRIRAIATVAATDLSSTLLDHGINLPIQLIHYVARTGETVAMDSADSQIPVIDRYLSEGQPASLLCLPLVDRTQIRGILYLENQATSGVFHPERLAALNLLATQAAIALENARLYQQSQAYARQLEESQLQLVQSEKMSALGNLVAGVAHEINNPLGFVGGNITELRAALQDMTEYLNLYERTLPPSSGPLAEKRAALEVDYLLEDLPKILNSMQVGCQRIRSISNSLRTFSRADTEAKFQANIHDGLDSTLLILKYRLKAKDFRPEIAVIREYGELPNIDCFPGQLNQVFMNILANAVDMFDEMAEARSRAERDAHPQQITICTHLSPPNGVIIRIRDNGKGMSEAVCAKIFDRKFTTKAVGKGTGLGLAIARQVVVEKHGGHLSVTSQLGQGTEFLIQLPC